MSSSSCPVPTTSTSRICQSFSYQTPIALVLPSLLRTCFAVIRYCSLPWSNVNAVPTVLSDLILNTRWRTLLFISICLRLSFWTLDFLVCPAFGFPSVLVVLLRRSGTRPRLAALSAVAVAAEPERVPGAVVAAAGFRHLLIVFDVFPPEFSAGAVAVRAAAALSVPELKPQFVLWALRRSRAVGRGALPHVGELPAVLAGPVFRRLLRGALPAPCGRPARPASTPLQRAPVGRPWCSARLTHRRAERVCLRRGVEGSGRPPEPPPRSFHQP